MAIRGHNCLREVAFKNIVSLLNHKSCRRGRFYPPTLAVESVKLFSVVLFPEEGFPTSPIRGSRGMLCGGRYAEPLFHGLFDVVSGKSKRECKNSAQGPSRINRGSEMYWEEG